MTQVWFGRVTLHGTRFLRPYAGFEEKTVEAQVAVVCAAAGIFRNLRVKLSDAPGGTAHREITLRVNGVDSTLQAAFIASDTDIRDTTHTVAVVPGDVLSLHSTEANFSATTLAQYTLEFEPTNPVQSIYGGSSPNGAPSSSNPLNGLFTSNQLWTLASNQEDNVVTAVGALTRFTVVVASAPGTGKSITFRVFKNGVATSALVTISDSATAGQWTGLLPLTIGDHVHQEFTVSGSPTLSEISWGACFSANQAGVWMLTAQRIATPSNAAVRYEAPSGTDGAAGYQATEANAEFLGPITPIALSGLYLDVLVAPGTGKSWAIVTRRNGATPTGTPSATLSDGALTASDTSGALALTDADTWTWQSTPSSAPQSSNLTWGWVGAPPGTVIVVGGGDDTGTTFENGVLTIGLTWLIITLRSGLQYVWSDRPLPDPVQYYLGWKAPRVTQWGRIRRALSGFDGQYETADFTVLLDDTDRILRQLDADKQLVNATVAVYMISDEGRRALQTAKTVYRGVVRDAAPQGTLAYKLTIKDSFEQQFSINSDPDQVPERTITTNDFANAGETLVTSSAEAYVVNGTVDVGATKVSVKSGRGVFAERDRVTFAGGADIYTVDAMSSCFVTDGIDLETYIVVSPALLTALSDGETITQIPSHQVDPALGERVPFAYGYITDRVLDGASPGMDTGDGQGPVRYVGDKVLSDGKTYGEFLWTGHACYAPGGRPFQMLYFWNEAVDNYGNGIYFPSIGTLDVEAGSGGRIAIPGYDLWDDLGFTAPYVDYGGRRYTVLYLRGIFRDWALGVRMPPANLGGVPFAVAAYGAEVVGDSSGALIINGLQQYKHIVKNWVPPKGTSYQGGIWLDAPTFPDDPSLPMIDEDSFDLADAQSKVYVDPDGFRGDFIVGANNEAIARRELIARLNVSFGVDCGFNRKTQFFVVMVNVDLGSTTLQPSLTYVRDIFAGTWSIEPITRELYTAIPYRHTQDYFNRVQGGWRSVLTQALEVESTAATGFYGAKTRSPQVTLYMVRGKNRTADPDDYLDGSATAGAVLALKLARVSVIQHVPKWQTGPAGFNYELGDIIPVTHYEGLSLIGWTDRLVRSERVETDPTNYTEGMEALDLAPLLVFVPGDSSVVGTVGTAITGSGGIAIPSTVVSGE